MSAFFTTEHLLANDAGREYRLRIWRPVNIAVGSRLNTLLLLDGHWLDDTLDAALDTVQAGTVQVASLGYRVAERSILADRTSTRLNSSHECASRMPSPP